HAPTPRRAPAPSRLLDQPLLDHPSALTLLVLLREVRLPAPGVRRPRGREPAPQLVVCGSVDPGQRLPLVQQLAEAVRAVAPVVALGELLGLGDQPLLLRLRGRGPLGAPRPPGLTLPPASR